MNTSITDPVLTDHMKQMLEAQLAFVTTVTDERTPHVAPKGSLNVWSETELWFHDTQAGQTLANIRAGSLVEVAVVDREQRNGYRFLGAPVVHDDGPVFEEAARRRGERGKSAPEAVVVVRLQHIESFRPLTTPKS